MAQIRKKDNILGFYSITVSEANRDVLGYFSEKTPFRHAEKRGVVKQLHTNQTRQ